MIKAIGENTDYVNGPEYQEQRPIQSQVYKGLNKDLSEG